MVMADELCPGIKTSRTAVLRMSYGALVGGLNMMSRVTLLSPGKGQ